MAKKLKLKKSEGVLWLGDCLEVMKKLPEGSIDMILTDLPYGTTYCKWDCVIPFDLLWVEIKKLVKRNTPILLFGTEPFSSHLRMSNLSHYKYDWIWYKNQPTGIGYSRHRPMNIYEIISVFCDGKHIYNPQKMLSRITDRKLGKSNGKFFSQKTESALIIPKKKNNPNNILRKMVLPRNVIESNVQPHSKGLLHPTQKPVALFEYLIKTYTNPGDTVLDCCAGSGTTGEACQNTGRNFILIEKELNYCRVIKDRLNLRKMKVLK